MAYNPQISNTPLTASGYFDPTITHANPAMQTQPIGADYAALMGHDVPFGQILTRIRHACLIFLCEYAFTLAFVLVVTAAAAGATIDPLGSPFVLSLGVGLIAFMAIWGLSFTSSPVCGFHTNWGISMMVYLSYVLNRANKGFHWKTLIQKILIGGVVFIMYLGLQIVAALSASFFLEYLIGSGSGLGFPAPVISTGKVATLTWFGSTIIGISYMYTHFVYKSSHAAAAYGAVFGAFTAASWAFIGLSFNPILYWGPAIALTTSSRAVAYVLASLGGYLSAWFIFETDRWFFRPRVIYVGWAPFNWTAWQETEVMRPYIKTNEDKV